MAATAVWIGARDFSLLPHIDVEGVAEEKLDEQVSAVLKVVAAHSLEAVVSVDRIHKHYDLASDDSEVILQDIDMQTRSITVRPVTRAAHQEDELIPSGWIYDTRSRQWRVVLFTNARGLDAAICRAIVQNSERVQNDTCALDDVMACLEHCNAALKLGVSLRLNELLAVPSDACLRESTFDDRSQTIAIGSAVNEADHNVTITSWSCAKNGDGIITRGCSRYCEWGPFKGHVTYHKVS